MCWALKARQKNIALILRALTKGRTGPDLGIKKMLLGSIGGEGMASEEVRLEATKEMKGVDRQIWVRTQASACFLGLSH